MMLPIDRQMIAQLLIIASVCVGGWMTFVQPILAETAALEAQLERSGAQAPPNAVSVDAVTGMHARLENVRARNAMASDSSQLYGLIMDLAADHGVIVRQLRPGGEADEKAGRVSVSQIDLTAEGEYEAVARFLRAVGGLEGYVRPAAVTLNPFRDGRRTLVQVQYTCDVIRFTIDRSVFQTEVAGAQP